MIGKIKISYTLDKIGHRIKTNIYKWNPFDCWHISHAFHISHCLYIDQELKFHNQIIEERVQSSHHIDIDDNML